MPGHILHSQPLAGSQGHYSNQICSLQFWAALLTVAGSYLFKILKTFFFCLPRLQDLNINITCCQCLSFFEISFIILCALKSSHDFLYVGCVPLGFLACKTLYSRNDFWVPSSSVFFFFSLMPVTQSDRIYILYVTSWPFLVPLVFSLIDI